MKNLKNYMGLIVVVAMATGCATGAGIKMPAEYAQPNKKIAVVSVAAPFPIELGLGAGGAFGMLGVLADIKGNESYRDQVGKKLANLLVDWRSEDVLRNAYEKQLEKKGYQVVAIKKIYPFPADAAGDPAKGMGDFDAMGKAAYAWNGPEKSIYDYSAIVKQHNPDAIIEVGYQGYKIDKRVGFGSSYRAITPMTLARAVHPRSGETIGRSRTYVVGGIQGGTPNHARLGEFDFDNEKELAPFIVRYKKVFEEEIEQLVKESIELLGL